MTPRAGDPVEALYPTVYRGYGLGFVVKDPDENGEYVVEFPYVDGVGRQFTAGELRVIRRGQP